VGALRSVIATVAAVATAIMSGALDRAHAGGTETPSFLLFAGTDLWRYGSFAYGGMLWSAEGLDKTGFAFKVLVSGGGYTFLSGYQNEGIDGTMLSVGALPGWRFSHGNLAVSVFAGPLVQDYRLVPFDPSARLHGFYVGGQFASDVWYQPTPATLVMVNGQIASIGPTGSLRTAFGVRVFDRMFVGPETQEIWCGEIEGLEWSAGGGWAIDSDHRTGPYMRLGFNARY